MRRIIPSCQLSVVWTKPSKPPVLIHQVALKGVKESSNFLFDCDSIPPVRGKLLICWYKLSVLCACVHACAHPYMCTVCTSVRSYVCFGSIDEEVTSFFFASSAVIEAVEFLGNEQLGKELKEKYCQL